MQGQEEGRREISNDRSSARCSLFVQSCVSNELNPRCSRPSSPVSCDGHSELCEHAIDAKEIVMTWCPASRVAVSELTRSRARPGPSLTTTDARRDMECDCERSGMHGVTIDMEWDSTELRSGA